MASHRLAPRSKTAVKHSGDEDADVEPRRRGENLMMAENESSDGPEDVQLSRIVVTTTLSTWLGLARICESAPEDGGYLRVAGCPTVESVDDVVQRQIRGRESKRNNEGIPDGPLTGG